MNQNTKRPIRNETRTSALSMNLVKSGLFTAAITAIVLWGIFDLPSLDANYFMTNCVNHLLTEFLTMLKYGAVVFASTVLPGALHTYANIAPNKDTIQSRSHPDSTNSMWSPLEVWSK